jgi:hypothetical protein
MATESSTLPSDTKVLGFMLCCIYTAVNGQARLPDEYGTERLYWLPVRFD